MHHYTFLVCILLPLCPHIPLLSSQLVNLWAFTSHGFLSWTVTSFLSDRFLRRKVQSVRAKDIKKYGLRRSYISSILWQAGLLRNTASYVPFPREKWNRASRNYHKMGWSSLKVNQAMLHKRNTGYLKSFIGQAHSSLGTDNYSPVWWEELGSQDPNPQLPWGPGSRTLLPLLSMFLTLDK